METYHSRWREQRKKTKRRPGQRGVCTTISFFLSMPRLKKSIEMQTGLDNCPACVHYHKGPISNCTQIQSYARIRAYTCTDNKYVVYIHLGWRRGKQNDAVVLSFLLRLSILEALPSYLQKPHHAIYVYIRTSTYR